jgi:hypothetical protein
MNKSLLIIFGLIVFFTDVNAKTYLRPNDKIPSDAAMALEFLQLYTSGPKSWDKEIRNLDQLLLHLSEEERLMILKSELYKAILKTSRGVSVERANYRPQTLERLQEKFGKVSPEKWDPFSTFFLRAVMSDLKRIMLDAEYPNFINNLRSNRGLTAAGRSFKQKLDVLLPWVQWYFEGSLPGLKQKLLQASEIALKLFADRASNLIFMTQFEKFDQKEEVKSLRFFEVQPIPNLASQDESSSEGALKQIDVSIPPAPQEGLDEKWVPKIAPDPDYQVPETLPEPVDDWLPKPVDDWLDNM